VLAYASETGDIVLLDTKSWVEVARLGSYLNRVENTGFVGDEGVLATQQWYDSVAVWDFGHPRPEYAEDNQYWLKRRPWRENASVSGREIQAEISERKDSVVIKTASGEELATIVFLDKKRAWIATTPDGRFDTDLNLDDVTGVHWVASNDSFHPLPPEIFMRDYYEPRLLPRLLAGELKPVRSLELLNRTQPEVGKPEVVVEPGNTKLVTVRVRVKSLRSEVQKDARGRFQQSGVYDMRLFRDGQLIGQRPSMGSEVEVATGPEDSEPERAAWRKRHQILDSRGTTMEKVIEFRHVRLPRNAEQKQVTFTAYAFSEDRVKSATATKTIDLGQTLKPRKGKAYVITVGVNRTESSPDWDLNYAANDARELSRVVSDRLGGKQFTAEPICLVSDHPDSKGIPCAKELPATKAHLQAVLDLLAGRAVKEPLRSQILKLGAIKRAEPEDLVLLTVSSHGYTDERGTFHFVLADIGAGQPQRVTEKLSKRTLSTDELSAWLRDVDAGEMVMVVPELCTAMSPPLRGDRDEPFGDPENMG